jgi:hypothetical protein
MTQQRPSDEVYAAAIERERIAAAAAIEANRASLLALQESIEATREVMRLDSLRRDLDEFVLEELALVTWVRGATVARIAKHVYRTPEEVRAALARLLAVGLVRQVGRTWEATA